MNNKYNNNTCIYTYRRVYVYIQTRYIHMHDYHSVRLSILRYYRSYKYLLQNSSTCVIIFQGLQKSIRIQHIKIQNLFLVPPITHFMCILTSTSRLTSATPFGASCMGTQHSGYVFFNLKACAGKGYIFEKEKVQKFMHC